LIRIPFHRCLAAIVLLGYLLCGNGLARAFVWCVDEAGHSHVEVNPAGNCQVSCDAPEDQAAPSEPGWHAAPLEKDCRDVSLLAGQAKNVRDLKLLPPDCTPLPLVVPPTLRSLAEHAPHPLHPPELTQPPPLTTALAALKTVVLLN
jgi:hypothetical protein